MRVFFEIFNCETDHPVECQALILCYFGFVHVELFEEFRGVLLEDFLTDKLSFDYFYCLKKILAISI
jgi:hypothetical protein